jgi:hypothetical protein
MIPHVFRDGAGASRRDSKGCRECRRKGYHNHLVKYLSRVEFTETVASVDVT